MSKVNAVVQFNRHLYLAMVVSLLVFGNAAQAIARQTLFESFKKIVVIDPGHGGQDFGAKGPDGTLEKTVTLKLARLIASELEPDFKVVLTRTDDFQVDLVNRTSLANHLKADIFISIHNGAGFVHSTTGTSIYFYQNFLKPDSGPQQPPSPADQTRNEPIFWRNVQNRHLSKSRELARTIDDHLKGITAIQSRIEGSPLAVLQGAAMPAILIEVGYLTNPAEEKNLRDNRFLMDFAELIRMGIEDFLSQNQQ